MDRNRKLKGMLARIFSDAVVDEAERAELRTFLAESGMTVPEIKAVFDDFVATTWKITMADGVVSDVEKTRLKEIVKVLKLPAPALPEEWAKIVGEG